MNDAGLTIFMAGFDPACLESVDKTYRYFAVHMVVQGEIWLRWGTRAAWTKHAAPVTWAGWPGQHLAWRSDQPRAHYRTAVVGESPARWMDEGLLPCRPVVVGEVDEAVAWWQRYLAAATGVTLRHRRRASLALEGFLLGLHEDAPRGEGTAASDLRALIDADPLSTPDYHEWSRGYGMTLAGLRRAFRRIYGLPPHRYLLQRRCAEARRLLITSDEPIEALARLLGYNDVFYFTRQFTALTGLSPAAFRRTGKG